MKKVYKESFKKIFASLFLLVYTFLPNGIVIADVVNELKEDSAAPIVEEKVEEIEEVGIVEEEPVVVNPEGEKILKETMSYPVWRVSGDIASTYEDVELGKVYVAPQDSRVKLIFTKLPEKSSKLTIEKIILTQEEVDFTGAISNIAYDITTDMENGTFEYDLELPSTEDNVKIVYVEDREDIFTNLIPVNNEIIQKRDTVKIRKVDHFSISIVTSPAPNLRTAWVNGVSQVTVLPNTNIVVTITVRLDEGTNWRTSRYQIGGGAWINVNTPDHTTNGTYTEEFHIAAPTIPGTYDLNLTVYSSSNYSGSSASLTLNEAITVEAVPALPNNDSDPVALTSVQGEWTNISGGSGYSGVGSNEIRWGSGTPKSGLRFTNSGLQSFDTGDSIYLGMLTHLNFPITAGTAANRATLQLTLNFNRPNIGEDNKVTFNYNFDIEETSNSSMSSCKPYQWSLTPCDDRITFPTSYGDTYFFIGDTKYTLVIDGFKEFYPGGNTVTQFVTEENKESTAILVGRLSHTLVERPAVSIEKFVNNILVEKEEDAPTLYVGDSVEWKYVVQNIGNVDLTNITVTDNKVSGIDCGGKTTLTVDEETMTCTASGTVTEGSYHNIATVTAKSPEGDDVSDTDDSWYTGVYRGGIKIVKKTQGGDGTFNFTSNFGVESLTTENGTVSIEKSGLVPGSFYSISEDDLEGWQLSSATCDRGTLDAIEVVSSDVTTCTFTNIKLPKLTVTKIVNNDNGGTRTVSSFPLFIDGNPVTSGSAKTLSVGTHTVSETTDSNYAQSFSGDCDSNGSITLQAGDVKSCTITNSDIAPTLTLVKKVVNDNGGKAKANAWTLSATGTERGFSGEGSQDGSENKAVLGPKDVKAGIEYTLGESGPSGYTASDWVCTGGGTQDDNKITLALNEHVTCTIINDDQQGTLIVKKILTNDNGGTKKAEDFSFKINNGGDISFKSNGQNEITVDAGIYNITENTVAGYVTSYDNCSNVEVPNGGTATCTITNNDIAPSLTLVKEVENNYGGTANPTDWTLTATGPTSISGSGGATSGDTFKAGTYILSESEGPKGYSAGSWSCTNDIAVSEGNSIVLDIGQSTTCTIINSDIQPKITVTKIVEGGNKEVSNFNLYVGETGVISGVQIGINTGTYIVSEDTDTDYNSVIGKDCASDGSITLALGDVKECTITNTRKTGQITFTKNISHGDASPSNWVFAVYKGSELVGTYNHDEVVTLDTGEYTVQEVGPTSSLPYYLDSIGGTACTGTISSGIADLTVTESGGTCVFGNSKKPTITVKKLIEPTNSQDTFEFTVNGETFTLGHSGVKTIDVMPGSYTIAESGTVGYRTEIECDGDTGPTLATMRTISLDAGDNKSCTFTNTKLGSISGTKWNDENGDGIKDEGEEPVQGVQICIDANTNGVCDTNEVSVDTDASGNYIFSDLLPGTYSIIEILNEEWEQTYPEGSHTVELSAGEKKTDYNFGNWKLNPGIQVAKSSDTEEITVANQVVPYIFTVTNAGNQTLTGVTVVDPRCTSAPVYQSGDTNGDNKLQTDETWIYTCNYTVLQSDIDTGGSLSNTVTANSTEVGPVKDTFNIPITQSPDMSVIKEADVESVNASGQIITYTIKVFNDGNTTLTDVSVADPLLPNLDCDGTAGSPYTTSGLTIDVDSSLTCTGTYTVTQNDIDSKEKILNTVTANNTATGSKTADEEVDVVKNPGMTVEKSSTTTLLSSPQTVSYSYLVTNTGNTTLTGITLSDDNDNDDMTCPKTTLQVNENMTCAATHTFTQEELDTIDTLDNIVTADSEQTKPVTDDLSIPISKNPKLSIEKTGVFDDGDDITNPRDLITYTFKVTNTGNITLTGITVTDPLLGGAIASCSKDTLLVGEYTTCTAIYEITQTDIDKGEVKNTATVGSTEGASDEDDETVKLSQNPLLSIVKSGTFKDENGDGFANVGEIISYTFTVKNEGNVTLTNVTVTDPLVTVSGGPITLDVGETDSTTFTATYTITQDDIDSGSFYNIATADSDESEEVTDDDTVDLPQNPRLSIEKIGVFNAGDDGITNPGDLITYSFLVTNTGNMTLTGIAVSDLLAGLSAISCPVTTLAVGEDTTCTATYEITQTDIDKGKVDNTATASSTEGASDEDDETVKLSQNPLLSIVKSGTWVDADGDGYADVGETISYTFTVTNGGNVTLTNVAVTDPLVTVSGGPITLDVGEIDSTTFTATYTITQDDIDSGSFYNIATASSNESDPATGDKTVDLPQNPLLSIVKSGTWVDGNEDGYANVGEVVNYEFVVTNIGNITLTGITVTDPLSGLSTISCPATTLAVGKDMTCTATYEITQTDIDTGEVENTATADSEESEEVTDNDTVELPQNPLLSIVKSGTFKDENGDGFANVGETISYTFTVTNEGNVTLTNVTVTDPLVTVSGGPITLDVGETDSTTFTATYTITQDDIDSGSFYNIATADSDESEEVTDDDTVDLPQNPRLSIEKIGVFNAGDDGIANPGDLITYTFKVRNIGNITLTGITVTDLLLGGDLVSCSRDTLLVGEDTTCTATYPVTQDDIDKGEVKNTATAGSTEGASDEDDEIVELPQEPGLSINKSATPSTYSKVGDIITYTFTVTNTGNITLSNISVEDSLVGLGDITCGNTSQGLAPNETVTCEAQYEITLDDLDNGEVVNSAYAKDDKETESEPDEETVTSIAGKITIQKVVEGEGIYEQEFEFEPSWAENFFLRAGESQVSDWLTPGTYDINEIVPAGWVLAEIYCEDQPENNVFSVMAIDNGREGDINLLPNGNILCTFTNEVITPLLQISKENDTAGAGMNPGDTVTYTITVIAPSDEKEGTYLLENVVVTDILPEGFTYIPGSWTGTTLEPVYGTTPAKWSIGDMQEGDTVVLTYQAVISSTQEPGTYPDIAWVEGKSLSGDSVLGVSTTDPEENFVGTEVKVIGELDIEEGDVLGVTTGLPATGASTYITLGALLSMFLGLLFILFKPGKKMKNLLVIGVLLLGIFTFVIPSTAHAEGGLSSSINVRIVQPEAKTNRDTFSIGFVVLDIEGRTFKVKCIEESYGEFDTHTTNSGNCKVDSSVIPQSGTYKFHVEVEAEGGLDNEMSKTVTVEVDLTKPSAVEGYSKKQGECTYTLSFKSSTPRVQIFRSEKQTFTANESTLITKPYLSVTPNTVTTYTDSNLPNCNKTYYYAVRSIDEFNNVSPLVTDKVVVVTPATTTATEATVAQTGEVEGKATVVDDTKVGEAGEVKGDEDVLEEDLINEKESVIEQDEVDDGEVEKKSFVQKYWLLLVLVVVVLIGGVGYSYVRKQK